MATPSLSGCVCPLGARTPTFLEDPGEPPASAKTLSTPDLGAVAGVTADATDAEGAWEGPAGAGEPRAPADSSEAMPGDRAHGGVGARGEARAWHSPVDGKAQAFVPRVGAERPCWEAAPAGRAPLLRCGAEAPGGQEVLLFGLRVSEQVSRWTGK